MNIDVIKSQLLAEAKSSPNLLSDLAGLETYISESYTNRSFIELLQNADDAGSSMFKIIKDDDFLYVANNGRIFNTKDIESICRSASSTKTRGESIGYRGIGFKSVVSFAKEIHIISGDLELTFSKEKTKLEIPSALKVPLIRIPHLTSEKDKLTFFKHKEKLINEGYTTVFIFTGVTANEIENEYKNFDYKSLLFLNNIISSEILISGNNLTHIEKKIVSESETKLKIRNNQEESEWLVSNLNNTSVAFQIENNLTIRINSNDALVYSFLPTEDITGIGVLLNGDFSTDPSRKHLIFDEQTNKTIENIAIQIINILSNNLFSDKLESKNIIKSIIPYSDPRMISFKKTSFEKLFLEQTKLVNPKLFENLLLAPNWLNSKDYNAIVKSETNQIIDTSILSIDGLISFLKFLGAKENSFEIIQKKINSSQISMLGCVQISKNIFTSIISTKNDNFIISIKDLKILFNDKKRVSFKEIEKDNLTIDNSFITLLIENGLTEFDVKQVIKKVIPNYKSELFTSKKVDLLEILPQKENINNIDWYNNPIEQSTEKVKYGLKRWRSAEEMTLEILNLNGFNLQDVSKQNIGYDLDGFDPKGEEIHIEVKSITLPGQKFKLTNNEIGVAQEKQKRFCIAIVRQTDDFFEIAMIPDPIKNLVLNRQCVQWIWECSEYEYNPKRFEL